VAGESDGGKNAFENVGQGNLAAQPKFAWLDESIRDSSGILRQKI